MSSAEPILEAGELRFGFRERPNFLGPLELAIRPGEFWGIIGPNGAGKTTLLRLLAGVIRPADGDVRLLGRPLSDWTWRQRARQLAYLPQKLVADPDASALEVVLMGRFPHRGYGLFESPTDYDIARQAMRLTETEPFADRPMITLSGGEAQRVHLAATLAQRPRVFLMDEPTSALDLAHQLAIFHILREFTRANHVATVVITHDINLAGHHCDHLVLMHQGRIVAQGKSADVLRPEVLQSVYAVRFAVHESVADGRLWILPQQVHVEGLRP